MALFEESEALGGGLTEVLGRLGQNASGVVGVLAHFFQNYGQAFFGLLGFSFGFWRWWRYREVILHKRLEQYIADSDQRLETAQEDLLEAVQRPGPALTFATPLFAEPDLTCVLRERRWDRTPLAVTVVRSADAQLVSAIDRITRRIEATASAASSLQKQLAAAHTLRGAIASVSKAPGQAEFALSCFRKALRIPNHRMSVFAKELEAHQLRRLGHFERAADAYRKLQSLTGNLDAREQAIINARAKRYLAEIAQLQTLLSFFEGRRPGPGSNEAIGLLEACFPDDDAPGALILREHFEPYLGWDLLESGDMSYFASFVCAVRTNHHRKADAHLDDAVSAYGGVLDNLRTHGPIYRATRKKLKRQAQLGLTRALAAKAGDYDFSWLMPALSVGQAQQITARIRASRG